MADNEIRFRMAFDNSQPKQGLRGLDQQLDGLFGKAQRGLSGVSGSVLGGAASTLRAGAAEGAGLSGIQSAVTSRIGTLFKFGLEDLTGADLDLVSAEEQATQSVAAREEALRRRGLSSGDDVILRELERQTRFYQRGLEGRERVERLALARENSTTGKFLGIVEEVADFFGGL